VGGDAEQAQHGLGELVDGGLGNAFGVPLAHPQQPEQAAGHGAERDLGIGNGEPARGLPGLDVAQAAAPSSVDRILRLARFRRSYPHQRAARLTVPPHAERPSPSQAG
jgi:hypothetical protein